jgi:3-deoxy-D-manno-octulosonic-acid transferase
MGNLKFDLTLPETLPEQGLALRRALGEERPVLIAASTHAGEEEQILEACEQLRRTLPNLLVELVPRHPERSPQIAELCRHRGLTVLARSEQRPCDLTTQIFLGDTLGELLLFFAAADVAFVGGSLVPVGGHNVLEPALLGLPVLFGPHMFNFSEASQHLLEAQAAWRVNDAAELADTAAKLFTDPALRQTAGQRGKAVVEANRGALAKLLEIIEGVLEGRQPTLDKS